LRPGDEGIPEGVVIERVEQAGQRVMAGHAAGEGEKPAQEVQVHLAPARDLDEPVRRAHFRAQHQQHDLIQWIQHLARLARFIEAGKILQERNALLLFSHGRPPIR
jgi:hypothetical protein